jgi:hypothetical protein
MVVHQKNSAAPDTAIELRGVILHDHEITSAQVSAAIQCLVDNGVDQDEAETVLQALGYILLDTDLFPEPI